MPVVEKLTWLWPADKCKLFPGLLELWMFILFEFWMLTSEGLLNDDQEAWNESEIKGSFKTQALDPLHTVCSGASLWATLEHLLIPYTTCHKKTFWSDLGDQGQNVHVRQNTPILICDVHSVFTH